MRVYLKVGKGIRASCGVEETRRKGFTLTEVSIAMAVVMILSAVVLPGITNAYYNSILRGTVHEFSGLLQGARTAAVQLNSNIATGKLTEGSRQYLYADINDNGTWENSSVSVNGVNISSEPVVALPRGVSIMFSPEGPGAPSALDAEHTTFNSVQERDIHFDPRGLPFGVETGPPDVVVRDSGFVYYLTDTRPLGHNGWAAVSVTPAGRIKVWYWYGGNWGN